MIRRTLLATIVTVLALLGLPGIASAQTGPGTCAKGDYFIVQYNDGGVDEGCYTKNDVYKYDVSPPLIANKLHVSCSDKGMNTGLPEKGDLGDPARRVVAYQIYDDGRLKCGNGTPIPGGGFAGLGLFTLAVGGLGMVSLRRRRNRAAAG